MFRILQQVASRGSYRSLIEEPAAIVAVRSLSRRGVPLARATCAGGVAAPGRLRLRKQRRVPDKPIGLAQAMQ